MGCPDTNMPKSVTVFIYIIIFFYQDKLSLSKYVSLFSRQYDQDYPSKCSLYQHNKLYTFFLRNKWYTKNAFSMKSISKFTGITQIQNLEREREREKERERTGKVSHEHYFYTVLLNQNPKNKVLYFNFSSNESY
jgi:hypothetical protein